TRFGELASDAIRYWEPRRLIYNGVLFAVVCVEYFVSLPASNALLTHDSLFVCFILAVFANVAYCAAYGVDLFVQFAGLRAMWARSRWAILLVGIAFASVITHFFMQGMLLEPPHR